MRKVSANKLANELGVSLTVIWNIIQKDEDKLLKEGVLEIGGRKLQRRYKIDKQKFAEFMKKNYPDKYYMIYEA